MRWRRCPRPALPKARWKVTPPAGARDLLVAPPGICATEMIRAEWMPILSVHVAAMIEDDDLCPLARTRDFFRLRISANFLAAARNSATYERVGHLITWSSLDERIELWCAMHFCPISYADDLILALPEEHATTARMLRETASAAERCVSMPEAFVGELLAREPIRELLPALPIVSILAALSGPDAVAPELTQGVPPVVWVNGWSGRSRGRGVAS